MRIIPAGQSRSCNLAVLELLLAEAFVNLKHDSPQKGLICLALEVTCIRDDPRKRLKPERYLNVGQIWSIAGKTYKAVSKFIKAAMNTS